MGTTGSHSERAARFQQEHCPKVVPGVLQQMPVVWQPLWVKPGSPQAVHTPLLHRWLLLDEPQSESRVHPQWG